MDGGLDLFVEYLQDKGIVKGVLKEAAQYNTGKWRFFYCDSNEAGILPPGAAAACRSHNIGLDGLGHVIGAGDSDWFEFLDDCADAKKVHRCLQHVVFPCAAYCASGNSKASDPILVKKGDTITFVGCISFPPMTLLTQVRIVAKKGKRSKLVTSILKN